MEEKSLKLNQETMDVLVANVIPTTKYFESQVDKRFILQKSTSEARSLSNNIDKLSKTIEVAIIDRNRYYDNRFKNFKMFNVAIVICISGIFLKLYNII